MPGNGRGRWAAIVLTFLVVAGITGEFISRETREPPAPLALTEGQPGALEVLETPADDLGTTWTAGSATDPETSRSAPCFCLRELGLWPTPGTGRPSNL